MGWGTGKEEGQVKGVEQTEVERGKQRGSQGRWNGQRHEKRGGSRAKGVGQEGGAEGRGVGQE